MSPLFLYILLQMASAGLLFKRYLVYRLQNPSNSESNYEFEMLKRKSEMLAKENGGDERIQKRLRKETETEKLEEQLEKAIA